VVVLPCSSEILLLSTPHIFLLFGNWSLAPQFTHIVAPTPQEFKFYR
jgi:hypothetical protein